MRSLARTASTTVRAAKATTSFSAKVNTYLRAFATFPNHSNSVNPPADVSNSTIKNSDTDKMFKGSRLKQRKVPIQLRQSGDAGDGGLDGKGSRLLIDTRV